MKRGRWNKEQSVKNPTPPRRRALAVAATVCFAAGTALAQQREVAASNELRMLGQCVECVVTDQNLSGQKLTAIDLRESRIERVDFSGARLGVARFDETVMRDVSFEGADLTGASFADARLTNVSFTGANLTGAVFEGVELGNTDLDAGILCNTQMPNDMLNNSECSTNRTVEPAARGG